MSEFNKPTDCYQPTGKYAGKRAAKYRRLSDEKQEEGWSLEFQNEKIQEAIELEGCIFDDKKHSWKDTHTGMEILERPGLNALRVAAKHGEFDILFLYKLDRFSRVGWQQEMIREELRRYGVTIVTLKKDEHADDNSPLGALIRGFYAFKAEEERNDIILRTQDGVRKKAMSGHLPGGGRPLYGYKWNADGKARTHYVVDEEKAQVVRRIFAMVKAGLSLRSIATTLTNENVPTPRGLSNQWNISSITDILANSFYTGKAAYYKMRCVKEAGRIRALPRPEQEQVVIPEGVVPALVNEETFEAVQRILTRNKEQAARNNKNPHEALLRCGLVICGHCGDKMVVQRNHGRYLYCCHRKITRRGDCPTASISTKKLDTEVWKRAQEIILNPTQVTEEVNKRRQADPTKDNHKSLKNQLAKVTHEIENCTKTLLEAKNETVRSIMSKELERLVKDQGQLEHALRNVHSQQKEWAKEQKKLDDFVQECAKMRGQLDDLNYEPTYEFKRNACEYFGLKAHVWRADHKPHSSIECNPPKIVPDSVCHSRRWPSCARL